MSRGRRRVWRRVWLVALPLFCGAAGAGAQNGVARHPLQGELRLDVLASRFTAAQLGAGLSTPLGTYVRLGAVGGGGIDWRDDEAVASARVDGVARFLLDPFRQFRWAPYAGGGLSGRWEEGARWRGYLLLVAGVEGPPTRGFLPAVELGIGGGARVGVVLRRVPAAQRR